MTPELPERANSKHERKHPENPPHPHLSQSLASILDVPIVPLDELAAAPKVDLGVRVDNRVPPVAGNVPASAATLPYGVFERALHFSCVGDFCFVLDIDGSGFVGEEEADEV